MGAINAGDTAWVLIASALVLLMVPALAFFYGGMVRKKNILSTLNLSFVMIAMLSIQWVLFGYSLVFAPDHAGIIGGLKYIGFSGVGTTPNPQYASSIPHLAFALFQMMFAIITPALITGAFVERVRFKTFLVFALIWATLDLRPSRPLDLGSGRDFSQAGGPRFCRWHSCAHHRGVFSPGICHCDRRP